MSRAVALRWGLLGTVLMLAVPARAQSLQNAQLRNSFQPAGAGARGAALGGAFIAVADDGTAAAFNPAGLAQLRRTEVVLVGYHDRLRSEAVTGAGFFETPVELARHTTPEFAGLALPFEAGGRRFTVQLSYQRSADLSGIGRGVVGFDSGPLAVPGLPEVSTSVLVALRTEQRGAMHTVSVAGGVDVVGPLSLGVAVNGWIGSWRASGRETSTVLLRVPGLAEPLAVPDATLDFDQDHGLRGGNANLGLLLRGARVSLGGVVRLGFSGTYSVSERGQITQGVPGGPGGAAPLALDMTTTLRWPRSAGAGLAVRPWRGLTLAVDYVHTSWSQAVVENVPNGALLTAAQADASGLPRTDVYLDRNFLDLYPASQTFTRDGGGWRLGAEYLVSLKRLVVPLRAGLVRERAAIPEATRVGGRGIQGLTFGTGLNWDRVVLDLAWERRSSDGVIAAALSPDFRSYLATLSDEHAVQSRLVASLVLRFGQAGDDPVGRLLKRVFGRD